jgi:hypothetical protein
MSQKTIKVFVTVVPAEIPQDAVAPATMQTFDGASVWLHGFDLYLRHERAGYLIKQIQSASELGEPL